MRYSWHDSHIRFFEEIDLGVEHESNGLDAESSRSWNRIYAGFELEPHPKVDATLKFWHIFSTGDNDPDIDEFLGNAELTLAYNTKPENGCGENLLEYNKRSSAFRAGILFPFGTTSEL